MIRGIDVSHHQQAEDIDWSRLRDEDDVRFCYIRASYGARKDSEAIEHARACEKAGIKYGLYHFFRHHQSAAAQIEAFLDVAGGTDPELPPALDLEKNKYDPPVQSWSLYTAAAEAVARGISDNCCVIYTSPDWFGRMTSGDDSFLEDHGNPLWIAHWDVPDPDAPRDWTIWQKGTRKFSGAPYELDVNEAKELPYIEKPEPAPDPEPDAWQKPLQVGDCLYVWPDGSLRRNAWEPTQ